MIKKLIIFAAVIIIMLSVFVVDVSAYDCSVEGHKMDFLTFVLPTCTTQGYEISQCKYCDYKTYFNYVPSLGHSFNNGTCSTCGEKDTSHTHSYVATVIKNATCTSNGIKKYQCSDTTCGDSYTVTIYATGHKMDYLNFVIPTCTTQGYEISECKYCGYQIYSNYVEPLGHDFVELSCSKCGYQREIDCSVEGHKMDYSGFVYPTCTTQGYEISECKYCGYKTYSNYVDALEHSYSYVVIIEPTCENFGAEQMQCICGRTGGTRTIPKLQHNYVLGECTKCGGREGQNTNIPGFPQVDLTKFSFVLDDLNKDTEFNAAMYPETSSEYTLNVFQVAESSSGQLFLYVYNPITNGVKLEASYINMSTEIYESKNPTYKFYSLTKLSESGQFTKYLVNGFKVKSTSSRYYNIVGIYTSYNADIHSPANSSDDIKNYVAIPVGKCFEAITKSGNVTYGCRKINYVDVESQDHGIVRLQDAYSFVYDKNTDVHYLAISINNFDVTKLYDVDVQFNTKSYFYHYCSAPREETKEYGELIPNFTTVLGREKVKNAGGGFLGTSFLSYNYEWDRIMKASDFKTMLEDITNEEVIDLDVDALNDSQFVISFYTTPYTRSSVTSGLQYIEEINSTIVSEVTLLRMHFATPEGTYNLGVVADVVTDDGVPDFETTPGDNFIENVEDTVGKFFGDDYDTLETILAIFFIVALVVVIILLVTYFKSHSLSNAYEDVLKVLKGKKNNRSKRVYRKSRRSYGNKSYNRKKGKKYYVQKSKRKTRVQTRYKKRT